mmetsp:Transcript_59579/g.122109  ORF Transcript_59579/g.122109 Transcript_59579/m.122109 type:complete len:200 (+) Transcript_59579:570-1169(+)
MPEDDRRGGEQARVTASHRHRVDRTSGKPTVRRGRGHIADDPCLHLALALDEHGLPPRAQRQPRRRQALPVALRHGLHRLLRHMHTNMALFTVLGRRRHSTRCVHCIPKDAEPRRRNPHHPRADRARANPHLQRRVLSVWPNYLPRLLCHPHACNDRLGYMPLRLERTPAPTPPSSLLRRPTRAPRGAEARNDVLVALF